jgi:hypothetical protein
MPVMSVELQRVVERFTLAVRELALGRDPLGERLGEAWMHLLSVQEQDVPEHLRAQFKAMEAVWLSKEPSDLDEAGLDEAARAILLMHVELLTRIRA